MDSILNSVKIQLGVSEEYTQFDPQIIMCINTALNTLTEEGIGPDGGFKITGASETYQDFIGDDKLLEQVKTYLFLRTKLLFDPPLSSFVMEAYKEQMAEILFRMNICVDPERTFLR